MTQRALAVWASMVLVTSAHGAALRMDCAPDAQPTESCSSVHGHLYVTNGIPVRIWVIGTKRVLAVRNADQLHATIWRYLNLETSLYGDFLVCPLSPDRPGQMQPVCVQSAERLVAERYNPKTDKNEVFRLLPTWPHDIQGSAGAIPSSAPHRARGALPNYWLKLTVRPVTGLACARPAPARPAA